MTRYFALWRNRNGQQLWAGPFPTNVAAAGELRMVIDKSGGSLVVRDIPMTSGERLEALPIVGQDPAPEAEGHSAGW